MINTTNLKEAQKLIEKYKKEGKEVTVKAQDIDFNREILENKKVNMLVLNHKLGKDKLKERNSGLNHILCKIARENNITLAVNLEELNTENKKEKAEILARIIQNIKLIKKYKNKLKILNSQDDYNTKSLLLILGMPTDMIPI